MQALAGNIAKFVVGVLVEATWYNPSVEAYYSSENQSLALVL